MTAKIIVSKSALEAEFKTVSQCKTADYCEGFNDALKTILDNAQVVNSVPVSKVEIPTNKAILPNGVAVSNVYEAYEVGLKQALQSSEPVAVRYKLQSSVNKWHYNGINDTIPTSNVSKLENLFATPQPAPDTVPRAEYNKLLDALKEALPQLRHEFIDLASKYAGTPFENEEVYLKIKTRYERIKQASNSRSRSRSRE